MVIFNLLENDTEIETKPLAARLFSTVNDSSGYSNNFPTMSTVQNNSFTTQSLRNQRRQKPRHKCEICSHKFPTVANLNAHRQQGCEALIEISSVAMDCKPTAVDFMNSQCDIETAENQAKDIERVIDMQSTSSKYVINPKQKKPGDGHKLLQYGMETGEVVQSDQETSRTRYPCELCDKVYTTIVRLTKHRHTHMDERPFKCKLCDKS